jgi:dynactin complex subunit
MSRRSSSSNPKQVISSGLIIFSLLFIFLISIIQNLQIENESLRQEISALQKILSIPIDENHRYTHFRYQIYSLEKQIALLTRLLDAKREAVATCETILLELNQFLQ